jgi:thymidylate synthase (FAD)
MKIAPIKVEYVDHMGSDLSVVNAARVSFHKKSDWDYGDGLGGFAEKPHLKSGDIKLINYLARHNHWTPFGHTSISLRIKAPIFVARQAGKHQVGLVWNEVSRRYVDDEPEFFFPKEYRKRAENAKQGSSHETTDFKYTSEFTGMDLRISEHANYLTTIMLEWYNQAIKNGVSPEQARMHLPQNMMTEWIWTGSLAAFCRVCKLRLDPHSQLEIQELAGGIQGVVGPLFPVSWDALMKTE